MKEGWKLSSVVLGVWDLNWTEETYKTRGEFPVPVNIPISKEVIHENYRMDSANKNDDIALLRLMYSVEYNYFVNPLCLPATTVVNKNFINTTFELYGFGIFDNFARILDPKRRTYADIIPYDDCNHIYNTTLTSKQLCVREVTDTARLFWGMFIDIFFFKIRHFVILNSFISLQLILVVD